MLAVALVMGNGSFLLPTTAQTAHAAVVEPVVLGNAGFESVGTNGELANWTQYVPATAAASDFSVVDSPVREGAHAYKLSATGLNANEKAFLHQEVSVEQNREYVLSGYLNVEQLENAVAQLYVEYISAEGQILAGGTVDQATVTDGYVRVQNNRLAPTGAAKMRVYVTLKALEDNASGTFYADGLHVRQTNGLLQNADFEAYEGASGTVDSWPLYQHPGTNVETSVVSSPVASGTKAQKVVGSAMQSGKAVGVHQMVAAEPNTPYTVTGRFNVESLDNAKVQLYVDYWDKDRNWLGMSIAEQTEATNGEWVTLKNEHVSPEDTAFFTVFALVRANADGAGGTFYVDEVSAARTNLDLVPTMKGLNLPLGETYANYGMDSSYLAFDEDGSTAWKSTTTASMLRYNFGTKATALEYEILPMTLPDAPKNWVLQGSMDGSTYTTIDTRSNLTNWKAGIPQRFTVAQPGSYKVYSLVVQSTNGAPAQVAELRLFGNYQTPEAPTGLWNTDSGDGRISLEWKGVNGATSYHVYQDGQLVKTVSSTGSSLVQATIGGLTNNQVYRFKVTAVNNAGESVHSQETRAMPYHADQVLYPTMTSNNAPLGGVWANYGIETAYKAFDRREDTYWKSTNTFGILDYQFLTPTRIREYSILTPTADSLPTSLYFQGSKDGKTWVTLDDIGTVKNWIPGTRKYFTLDDAKPEVRDWYRYFRLGVRNINGGTNAQVSELQLIGSYEAPDTPENLWHTNSSDQEVSLEWKGVNGATAYHVYEGENRVATVSHSGAPLEKVTITGLTNNQVHRFKVAAANEAGESEKSPEVLTVPYAHSQVLYPTMTSNDAPLGGVWANYGLESAYKAFDHREDTYWKSTNTFGILDYQFLTPTRIREYSILTPTADSLPTSLYFQGSKDGKTWVTLDNIGTVKNWMPGTRKYFTLDDAKPEVRDWYRYYRLGVRTINGGTNVQVSELQLIGSYEIPDAPVGLWNTSSTDGTVNLEWKGVNGAKAYHVYQGTEKVLTVTSRGLGLEQATIGGLSNNQVYSFSVTAENEAGESSRSASVRAVPFTDANLLTSAMTSNSMTSGSVAANYGTGTAFQAFDRKAETAWSSTTSSGVLTYDLQKPSLLKELVILPLTATSAPTSFYIQGSNDNVNWKTIEDKSNVTTWMDGIGKFITLDDSKPEVNTAYRYLRIGFRATNGGSLLQISELQLIGTKP